VVLGRAGIDRRCLELLVQRQLLDQRVTQIVVVIHDQNLAGGGHQGESLQHVSEVNTAR